MATITFRDRKIECRSDVLSSLERAGIAIPNSCRSGHCQSCKAQLVSGQVSAFAQRGLSERQRGLNYFLTCQCYPEHDIEVELLDDDSRRDALLLEKSVLSKDVMRARFKVEMDWKAGQYVTLWRSETAGRVYSIASRVEEGFMELHLRRRNGLVSGWLEHQLTIGDSCEISLPCGDCYYSPAMPKQPMVMIGTGTGLAPLLGVLKQALADAHHGMIYLYPVAGSTAQLYLIDELKKLAKHHPALRVYPVVRRNNGRRRAEIFEGDVMDLVMENHISFRGHLVYLCGKPEMIAQMKTHSFMRGADNGDIFYDVFEPGTTDVATTELRSAL